MKIYYMDKEVYRDNKGRFTSIKNKAKKFFKSVLFVSICASALYGSAMIGSAMSVKVVTNTITQEIEVTKRLPIQDRIAGCESEGNAKSKGSHFDSKGRIRKHANKDGTVDIGKNMINDYHWEAKAVELGFNIYTEKGNDQMANYIFAHQGSAPWSASSKCWNK